MDACTRGKHLGLGSYVPTDKTEHSTGVYSEEFESRQERGVMCAYEPSMWAHRSGIQSHLLLPAEFECEDSTGYMRPDVAQLLEYLSSMVKALGSIPGTAQAWCSCTQL